MTSSLAYVWVWLPGTTEPVVAGRLDAAGGSHSFTYGRSYLSRDNAVPLFLPELPLDSSRHVPGPDMEAHGCILDAGPDYWGRRVILAKHFGHLDTNIDTDDLPLLTYLLESGSDRIGALDFQTSATQYVPRLFEHEASLVDLVEASDQLEQGKDLKPALVEALLRGTSIGGARPKALIDDDSRKLIAKFSSTTDTYPVVGAETAAMNLARLAGLDVARSEAVSAGGRQVLLVERFDRGPSGERRMMVSALTMLGLDPMNGRYAIYPQLADVIRARFTNPDKTLVELFKRIVFNVIIGNTDDHARNHAAFWDGRDLELTPAYDLCPQPRSGGEVTHAMAISRDGDRRSRLQTCEKASAVFHLSSSEAKDIIEYQLATVEGNWASAADAANLDDVDRNRLYGGAVMNPSIFYTD